MGGWDAGDQRDPREARRNDRYTYCGGVAAKQASRDAGLEMGREDPDRVGVMIGSGIGGMYTYESQLKVLADRGPRKVSPFTIPSLNGNMCAGLFAIELGVPRPTFRVVSACATGPDALGSAAPAPRQGAVAHIVEGRTRAAPTAVPHPGESA